MAPSLLNRFATGLLLRKLLASQERQEQHLGVIANSLERLAEKFAPGVVDTPLEELRQNTVSFSRDAEQVRIQEFEEAFFRRLARPPSEAEILDHLDGKMAGLDQ
jgi:hypothetical protein